MLIICRKIILELKSNIFRVSLYFLTVITTEERSDVAKKTLDKIFDLAWKLHFINFHVLIKMKNDSFWSLITYIPYQRDCYKLVHQTVETFTYENFTNIMTLPFSVLYPEKMLNMAGCPIYVATFQIEPYVIQHFNGTHSTFEGIDVKIVTEIAKEMNFKPEFILPNDGMGRGIVLENGTVTGALKLVSKSI